MDISAIPFAGSIANAAAVIICGAIGLLIGRRLPERIGHAMITSLGLFTSVLGISMALSSGSPSLAAIISIVAGTAIGEALDIETRLERLADAIKARLKLRDEKFVEAFVSTSLIYCVGSMAILGAIEEGLGGWPSILLAKSLMDGLSGIPFAATLGVGVLFSAGPVLIYQVLLTIGASAVERFMTPEIVASITSVGGLMILSIGLNLIGVTKIRTSCQLPALVIAAVAAAAF